MWNFKLTYLHAVLCCVAVSQVWADNLTLAGDSHLTGSLHTLSTDGMLEFNSPLAVQPIQVKLDQVNKLTFSPPAPPPTTTSTRHDLTNGDQLMVNVDSLDGQSFTVTTPFGGHLIFPRSVVKTMQFGLHEPSVFYTGPLRANEWTYGNDPSTNWSFADNTLSADGKAASSKEFVLPERFVLKLSLKWESNANFLITFADPLLQTTDPVDRYLFLFNGAGIEIKRESTKTPQFQTILTRNRTPDQFPTNTLDVEIRVDRRSSQLYLYLNGEPEVSGIDPLSQAPTSHGVTLVNRAPAGSHQEIKSIELLSFDNTAARHLAEKSSPNEDSLITRDEDRFSGKLLEIQPASTSRIFSFKTRFKETPLSLNEEDVSTLFFAQGDDASSTRTSSLYLIHLWDQSRLSAISCTFSADQVQLVHPLLGPITLNRSAVSEFERLSPESATSPEE